MKGGKILNNENFKNLLVKTLTTVCEISKKKQSTCCSIFHQPKRPKVLKKNMIIF